MPVNVEIRMEGRSAVANFAWVIDQTSCIGCHACTTACKAEHDVPLGVNRTWVKYVETGTVPATRRQIAVLRCNHCAEPPCVEVCPTRAMVQRPEAVLEAVFATLALAAALMMLLLRGRIVAEVDGQPTFNAALATVIGGSVGLLAGLVGAGGAFILIPLMLHVLRIPLRVVVGTSLAIVAASALAGLAGKALTGQVDWLLALGLVVGALPGGRLGSYVSHRTRVSWLATILGLVIAFVAARMWLEILA
jgi:ferredoxin